MTKTARKSLSVIGAGKLGRSLAHIWSQQDVFTILSICNRSLASAEKAIDFIGDGIACDKPEHLIKSDIVLIATPDSSIDSVCSELVSHHQWIKHATVFHCSGALASDALHSAGDAGAAVASVHPVKSFAVPEAAITSFNGTYCGAEGNPMALKVLEPSFKAIGARFIALSSENKTLYHCAAVVANNYYVSLIDASQRIYEEAGISREQSMALLAPMLRETTENLITLGTRQSLTGPVARADVKTIEKHLKALDKLPVEFDELYSVLGKFAANLTKHSNIINKALHKTPNKG